MKALDLVGSKFGRLTVLARSEMRKYGGQVVWECACECGRRAFPTTGKLTSGNTKSCGCGFGRGRRVKHGLWKAFPAEHRIWTSMLNRCLCKSTRGYRWYGARGIKVCERWLQFDAFLKDMGPKPTRGHSIDRIDPAGNYEHANCRWADSQTQAANRRTTRLYEYRGKMLPLTRIAAAHGIQSMTMYHRVLKLGLSVEDALTYKRYA